MRTSHLRTALMHSAMALAVSASGLAAANAPSANHSSKPRHCSSTTQTLFRACEHQTEGDFLVTKSKCINSEDEDAREECFEAALQDRDDAYQLCRGQRAERVALCGALGEARYDPSFEPQDFDSDYHNLTNPNPYFPLTIGYRWEYAGGEETNTITALDETKLIEGVTCITLKDLRYEAGKLVEETDDWYGQRKNGTVDFCGEQVLNYETFTGDRPAKPEVLSTEGQWKTGREGDPSGPYLLGVPTVGAIHRQEFSPGNAEDVAEYLSITYRYGDNPALDKHVPMELAKLFCNTRDCVVTGESTALEPGTFHRKYYARGVGFFLEVDPRSGQTLQLVGCNFDSRCSRLPRRR